MAPWNLSIAFGGLEPRMDKPEIKRRLEAAMQEYVSERRSEVGRLTRYGLQVEPLSDDGAEFDLTFTFLAGETYCCLEYSCHFGFRDHTWPMFREILAASGWQPARRIAIRSVTVHVEAGALDTIPDSWKTYPFLGGPSCYIENPEFEVDPAPKPPELQRQNRSREFDTRREELLHDAQIATNERPEDYRSWVELAFALGYADRPKEALEPMRRAVALAPDDLFVLGSFLVDLALAGHHAEVVRECEALLLRTPGLTWAENLKQGALLAMSPKA